MTKKVGRPTKYRSKMCETVIELMRDGASQDEVIGHLDISRETFYRWKEENQEFSDSIKRGTSLSRSWWEKKGRINLENGQFNYTGWYMNMKNRFKWADKQEVKNEGITTVIVKSKIPHYPGEQDEPGYKQDED